MACLPSLTWLTQIQLSFSSVTWPNKKIKNKNHLIGTHHPRIIITTIINYVAKTHNKLFLPLNYNQNESKILPWLMKYVFHTLLHVGPILLTLKQYAPSSQRWLFLTATNNIMPPSQYASLTFLLRNNIAIFSWFTHQNNLPRRNKHTRPHRQNLHFSSSGTIYLANPNTYTNL